MPLSKSAKNWLRALRGHLRCEVNKIVKAWPERTSDIVDPTPHVEYHPCIYQRMVKKELVKLTMEVLRRDLPAFMHDTDKEVLETEVEYLVDLVAVLKYPEMHWEWEFGQPKPYPTRYERVCDLMNRVQHVQTNPDY